MSLGLDSHVAYTRGDPFIYVGGKTVAKRQARNGLVRLALTTLAALLACAAVVSPNAHADECPNAAFRTGPSAHLPDCRAYEQVTPPFKNAGQPFIGAYSPEGSSLLLRLSAATDGLEGLPGAGLNGPQGFYSVQRTAAGWATVPDNPPAPEYLPFATYSIPEDFGGESLDGQTTVWLEREVGQPDNSVSFFRRERGRPLEEIGPGLPPSAPAGSVEQVGIATNMRVVGASADTSRLLFTLQGDYWPFDATEPASGDQSLYEYIGTGNTTPMLVGVNDVGTLISKCGTELGSGQGDLEGKHNAMSTDGRTIFFTARCGVRTENELYARIDNGEPDARTVAISEPSRADCAACDTEAGALTADARFEGASEDGSKVFFSTTQPLLEGAVGSNHYEYDFDAPAGERVIRVSRGASEPRSFGPTLVSEYGSDFYFFAQAVLTTTPNGVGEAAEAGGENLYVFERNASYPAGRIEFVARLSEEDVALWLQQAGGDVTPDGRFLVFTSERDLTPDDTSKEVRQAFEYDAHTGALVRVSIGQDGFNNDGNVPPIPAFSNHHYIRNNEDNAEIVTPGSWKNPRGYGGVQDDASAYWGSLSVSADGSYVFFQSSVGLTPQAIDRKVIGSFISGGNLIHAYASNIYEYHDGRVSLISDSQDFSYTQTYEVEQMSKVQLLGTDESGDDVMFRTSDQLVGQDADTGVDIYDARVDGGFPAPAAPAACAGEACQGQLSGTPILLSPGSELQAGGNPPLSAPSTPKTAATRKSKVKSKKQTKTRSKKGCKRHKCPKVKSRKASDKRRTRS